MEECFLLSFLKGFSDHEDFWAIHGEKWCSFGPPDSDSLPRVYAWGILAHMRPASLKSPNLLHQQPLQHKYFNPPIFSLYSPLTSHSPTDQDRAPMGRAVRLSIIQTKRKWPLTHKSRQIHNGLHPSPWPSSTQQVWYTGINWSVTVHA